MGKTIFAEEYVEQYVNALVVDAEQSTGLIIGQHTSSRDYAMHLVKTPDVSEEDHVDFDPEEKAVVKKPITKAKGRSLEGLDEQWLATHVKQVDRMLVGGLTVLGVFAVGPAVVLQKSQSKLRQCVFAVHKSLTKTGLSTILPSHASLTTKDMILLQICTTTRKLTCKTYDVEDYKNTVGQPAEWKYQTFIKNWSTLKTETTMSVVLPIPDHTLTLYKQIQTGIRPFCESISSSMVMVNGALLTDSDVLQKSALPMTSDKGVTNQTYNIDLMIPCVGKDLNTNPVIIDNMGWLRLSGVMCGRALVHSKATVAEAIQAVKTDILRSLVSRCELLCEDIDIVDEVTEVKQYYDTPRRVLVTSPHCGLQCFSDYTFIDEEKSEVMERLTELLGITLTEEQIDMDCETIAEDNVTEMLDNTTTEVMTQPAKGKQLDVRIIGGLAAAAIAVLAVFVSSYTMFLGDV